MKHEIYRILLVGDNRTVLDMFFSHMEYYEVQTASTRTDDVQCHLKYFQPQAFVFCIVNGDYNGIKKVGNVKPYLVKAYNIPFIFIGSAEDCAKVEKIIPNIVDVYIEKPFTVAAIQNKIDELIERREEIIAEERKQQEEFGTTEDAEEEAGNKEKEDDEVKKSGGTGKDIMSEEMDLDMDALIALTKSEDRRKHILVIDDDSGMLKVIKEHLKENYDVATAISGKLARKFLEKKKTDLILLDYMMPGEDGPAVLKTFRENPETKNLPVVFLTGMTDREKIIELLRSEDRPQGYIVKPVEKDKLLSEIRNIIGE